MTVPRELKITYGSLAASGTSNGATLTLVGVHRLRKSGDSFEVAYRFLLTSPVSSTLAAAKTVMAAATAAVEAALRQERQDVKVEVLNPATQAVSDTLLSLSHTSNTGLNIRAEWSKPGGEEDTVLSRLYEVRVFGELPPGLSSLEGRRELEYEVGTDESGIGTLVVSGVYTAQGATQARAQFVAKIDGRVATITSALGGTWEKTRTIVTPGDTDQVARFRVEYRQRIFQDATNALDGSTLTSERLEIGAGVPGSVGSKDDKPLRRIRASYSANVQQSVTSGAALRGLYEGTVFPWIVAKIKQFAGTNRLAVEYHEPTYNPHDNTLTATVTALGAVGSGTLSKVVTIGYATDYGHLLREVWPDGAALSAAYDYQGPKVVTRTTTTVTESLGGGGGGAGGGRGGAGPGVIPVGLGVPRDLLQLGEPFQKAFGIGVISKPGESFLSFEAAEGGGGRNGGNVEPGGGAKQAIGGAGGWVLLSESDTSTERWRGVSPYRFQTTERTVVQTERLVEAVPAVGGGAGNGPAATQQKVRR